MYKILIGVLFLLVVSISISAQSADNGCHKSSEGTNFWFGFMESRNYNPPHYLEIMVCAREKTTFTLTVGPRETPIGGAYAVESNGSVVVRIPDWRIAEADSSESVEDKGLHLVSEKAVNVFALNYDRNSNDVATIYPAESLGNEYFAVCYTPSVDQGESNEGRNSEFLIVATEDNTRVSITPAKETDKKRQAGQPFEITLNKGQVYQVQSKNLDNVFTTKQGDLTGSYIRSDKNIALFSGSLSAKVPETTIGFWDHLYEQIPPVHAWGREYYTIPLQFRYKDRFRILASRDSTKVTGEGFSSFFLNKGEFKELIFTNSELNKIRADKRILVAQYSLSREEDKGSYAGGNLEPFMIILSPVEQMRNSANFLVYPGAQTWDYFVNVFCKSSQAENIRLDGNPVHMLDGTDGYHFRWLKLDNGVHTIWNADPDEGLIAVTYSYGYNESYGYGAAFNLDRLLDLGETLDFEGDTLLLCYGSTRVLDAGAGFAKYEWNTGATTQSVTVSSPGRYSLTVTDINGCTQSDTVEVFLSHPVVNLGVNDTTTCAPFSVVLDASDRFESYLWNTGQETQSITASKTGQYIVTVADKYGCQATDEVNLVVYPVPEIDFDAPSLVCSSNEATINVSLSGADPSNWDFPGSTFWSADKPELLEILPINQASIKVTAKESGDYLVSFHLTTKDGCSTVKKFKIGFYETPTSFFEFPDSPNDTCGAYSREVLYSGMASDNANFIWDFDGSLPTDTLEGRQHFRISLGIGSHPEISLVVEDNGCYSEPFVRGIAAIPNFNISVDSTRGCSALHASFSAELLAGEKIDYYWDFGDGQSSKLRKPTNFYTSAGFYDVGFKVVNQSNNCKAFYSFEDMIKVFPKPLASFSADPDICYPDTIDIIYLNNNDSSICYWQFDGMHRIDDGNDSIRVVFEKPQANVSLIVEENACSSDPIAKLIDRNPIFDIISGSNEGCQPLLVYTDAVSKDENLIFRWLTETKPYPIGKSNQYLFANPGLFDIAAIGFSPVTGCTDTLVKPQYVDVHPKPTAQFEVDHAAVYVDNSEISFTNLSFNAIAYYWDFDDGHFSSIVNPKYSFGGAGAYNTTLFASSEFGCRDTASLLINVLPFSFFAPNAFRPESDIAENRYFMPVNVGVDPERIKVRIFNRWGQLMFESNHLTDKWDGKTRDGDSAPMGNYIWSADYYDLLGFRHQQKGQVLLIR